MDYIFKVVIAFCVVTFVMLVLEFILGTEGMFRAMVAGIFFRMMMREVRDL